MLRNKFNDAQHAVHFYAHTKKVQANSTHHTTDPDSKSTPP